MTGARYNLITVISATIAEASSFIKIGGFTEIDKLVYGTIYHSYKFPDVMVVTGVTGPKNTKSLTADIANKFNSDLIISIGFASSVRSELNTGNLVICDSIYSLTGPPAYWNHNSASQLTSDYATMNQSYQQSKYTLGDRPVIGGCLTLPQQFVSTNMKNWIGYRFPVAIIDMEAYHIVEQSKANEISCVVVRAIVNPFSQTSDRFTLFDEGLSSANILNRILGTLLYYPIGIVDSLKTAARTKEAGFSLSTFLLGYSDNEFRNS